MNIEDKTTRVTIDGREYLRVNAGESFYLDGCRVYAGNLMEIQAGSSTEKSPTEPALDSVVGGSATNTKEGGKE